MNKNNDRKILGIIVLIVFTLIIIQTFNNVRESFKIPQNKSKANKIILISDTKITGNFDAEFSSVGRASICINKAPEITYDCNLTNAMIDANETINCTFNASDYGPVVFSSQWLTTPEMFNISVNGSINFKPPHSALDKNNTVVITAMDNSGCPNSNTSTEYNITITGINQAPYLTRNMSNEQIVKYNYVSYYLTDYFTDPDEDLLTYFSIMPSGSTVRVTIVNGSVEVKGIGCGVSTVYFVAVDPFGLTAQSNTIQYDITCPDVTESSPGSSSGSSGSGSSGSSTSECEPQWRCGGWAPCAQDNTTYRRCIDFNGCSNNYEQFFFDNCTYVRNVFCEEKWDCGAWSNCINNTHSRVCLDVNNCPTNASKPKEIEQCGLGACFNNIQDQDETGIDCGGSCKACISIENPGRVTKSITALVVSIIIFASIGIIIFSYRKKLFAPMQKKTVTRKIYINNIQKEKLLANVNIIQARLDEHNIIHAVDELSVFIKQYFKELLAIDNLTRQEMLSKLIKLKDKELEKILVMFYAKIINVVHARNKGLPLSEIELQALVDESSHEIFLISEFTNKDALDSVKDRQEISKNNVDLIYNKLSNLYIALKYKEIIVAKNTYKEILIHYGKLSEEEKSRIYQDTIRAFHSIEYLEKEYTNGKK